ncbi:hypothetical protein EWM64_g671 [Hericium alpestre]|uniref:Gfd2/YDR514C-like C-terminal domain-containing protein n=1 Tax=Hericium alpestre TaxID=135208 RepID=A0A4Z0AAJ0_9AGAM|nr:hypothetical protein EWM64_g671 [Hericium alpestre]
MIKTRFGETLPMADNFLKVEAFETHQRHLRTVTDYAVYKKLYATLPAVVLAALKVRVRSGEPRAIQELWAARDRTFMAIDFESSERNSSTVLEWGYAAVRCGHLEMIGSWPPVPEDNYRKGHYIVSEWVDKIRNRYSPNFPHQYAFGESQTIPKAKLPQIIQAVLSSLASPDSETTSNSLVLVSHTPSEDLRRMEEMRIKVPHNILVIDTAAFESALFKAGRRGAMIDAKSGQPRQPGSALSLSSLVLSLGFNVDYVFHNAGNDAFANLLALQKLLDPENTQAPSPRPQNAMLRTSRAISMGPLTAPFSPMLTPPLMPMSPMARAYSTSPQFTPNGSGYFNQSASDPHLNRFSRWGPSGQRAVSLPLDEQGRLKPRPSSGASADRLSADMANVIIG